MNNIFITDIDTILEVYELAKNNGKKEGDNIQEEFTEIMKRYPEKFKYLGVTEMDKDLLLGNIREETKKKVLDMTKKEHIHE